MAQNQQRLREIFKEPPLISYRKGKSLKDLLVRAKLWRSYYFKYDLVQESCDARRLFLTIKNDVFFPCELNYTFSQTSKAAAVCAEFRSKLPRVSSPKTWIQ